MVVKRQCSFCANEIEPGTGVMFVKRDGAVFHFCSSSCRKQQLHLGRVGHRHKWTRAHAMKRLASRATTTHSAEPGAVAPSPSPAPTSEAEPPETAAAPPAAPPAPPVEAAPTTSSPAPESTTPAAAEPKKHRRRPKAEPSATGEPAPPASPPTPPAN